MRLISLFAVAIMALPFVSCTKDPDLNPEPTGPTSESRQNPWNSPVPGQGGGPMGGSLPPQMQMRR